MIDENPGDLQLLDGPDVSAPKMPPPSSSGSGGRSLSLRPWHVRHRRGIEELAIRDAARIARRSRNGAIDAEILHRTRWRSSADHAAQRIPARG